MNASIGNKIHQGIARILIVIFALLAVGYSNFAFAASIHVRDVRDLERAVRFANKTGGNTTIELADGIYTLSRGLNIRAPNIAIVGRSEDPDKVVIQGDAMRPDAQVGNVITVNADGFLLDGITLQKSRYHLIQIKGENDADGVTIRNCILKDSYQQLFKVTKGPKNTGIASDNGIVEDCVFEYSAGVGPQHYIGGIDAHGARDWVVRNNTFRNIISPGRSVAEYAIHFWNGSARNTVERNLIINCDRGIGFGLGQRGNTDGVIRNNMIYHAENRGQFADVGIALHNSPGSRIYNNTIYLAHRYPNAIEYRFPKTTGVLIANNLTNRRIRSLKSGSATLSANITNVDLSTFVNPSIGDLHLQTENREIVDRGEPLPDLFDDYDEQSRPQGDGVDIGADEI